MIRTEAGPLGVIINFSASGYVVQSGHPLAGTVLMPGRAIDDFGFIDTLIGIRHAFTGDNDDVLLGGSGENRFNSGGGADVLVGFAGADDLFGNTGVDTVDYSREAGTYGVFVNLGPSGVQVRPQYAHAGSQLMPNSAIDSYATSMSSTASRTSRQAISTTSFTVTMRRIASTPAAVATTPLDAAATT